jgi:LysR family hydrogen peroxide-inducible transcriptional activator
LLDIQLVDRTNRSVTVTNIGTDIAVQARLVLRDLEALIEVARENRLPFHGELALGVIPTISPFLLPGLLPRLREEFPELRLILREGLTGDLYLRLMDGELDVVLIALPYPLPRTETLALFRDEFLLACHRNSPLVGKGRYSVQKLAPESVLPLEDVHCMRDHALSTCKVHNADKISPVSATSFLTLVQMVDADPGITYLPEMAVGSTLLANTDIETRQLPNRPARDIGLAWRKNSSRDEEFRELGSFIKKHRG